MTGSLAPRNPSRLSIELRLVLWAPLILAAILTAPDPDLFGRLVLAADALRNGLPDIDPYSFTSGDNPWINHEVRGGPHPPTGDKGRRNGYLRPVASGLIRARSGATGRVSPMGMEMT